LYLGGYEVWRRYISNGGNWDLHDARETVHVSDDARRICMVETQTWEDENELTSPTPRLRFQLDDHLGTVAVEVDAMGNVISYEQYHPYGTSAYRAQDGSLGVSAKRYRYNGKERDDETKLYYYGARYYAPWLGRWTAADPLAFADGVGAYTYVRGSPIRLGDPNGTLSWEGVKNFFDIGKLEGPKRIGYSGVGATAEGAAYGLKVRREAVDLVKESPLAKGARQNEEGRAEMQARSGELAKAQSPLGLPPGGGQFDMEEPPIVKAWRAVRAAVNESEEISPQRALALGAAYGFLDSVPGTKKAGFIPEEPPDVLAGNPYFEYGRTGGQAGALLLSARTGPGGTQQTAVVNAATGEVVVVAGGAAVVEGTLAAAVQANVALSTGGSESDDEEIPPEEKAPPENLPFKEGDLVFREYEIQGQAIQVLAEVKITGRKLTLSDIAVYPKSGTLANQLGPTGAMSVFRKLGDEARALGFESLQITGTRLSGAYIGKAIDVTRKLAP
jgi:RHS repeat-associated protein